MPFSFWIKRYLFIFALVATVLLCVYLVRGKPVATAVTEALLWAAISAAVVIATRLVRLRRGERCAMCNDSPEDLPSAP